MRMTSAPDRRDSGLHRATSVPSEDAHATGARVPADAHLAPNRLPNAILFAKDQPSRRRTPPPGRLHTRCRLAQQGCKRGVPTGPLLLTSTLLLNRLAEPRHVDATAGCVHRRRCCGRICYPQHRSPWPSDATGRLSAAVVEAIVGGVV